MCFWINEAREPDVSAPLSGVFRRGNFLEAITLGAGLRFGGGSRFQRAFLLCTDVHYAIILAWRFGSGCHWEEIAMPCSFACESRRRNIKENDGDQDPLTSSIDDRREDRIIGVVEFRDHHKRLAEAVLAGDGTWNCPKLPVLNRVLNSLYDPRRSTLASVPFGHEAVRRTAAWLKGTAWFSDQSHVPADVNRPPGFPSPHSGR